MKKLGGHVHADITLWALVKCCVDFAGYMRHSLKWMCINGHFQREWVGYDKSV